MNATLNMNATTSGTSHAMEVVEKALKAAHELHRVRPKTAEIRKAIESSDFDTCFSTAQKYLKQYRVLINAYSFLTNIQVIDISMEDAQSKSIQEWIDVLSFIEMIIYLDTALHYGVKAAIEYRIKQAFQVQ